MDRASARRGRAAGDRPSPARPPSSGGRPKRRPPRPTASQQASPRSHPRSKNRPRKRPPPPSIAIKVVVRRLPPTLSADQFRTHANPKGADKALWSAYYPGKVEAVGAVKRSAQVVRHSVAYLAFEKLEDASHFFNEFDGFKFVDAGKTIDSSLQTGTDYYARVERTMFQTTPPLTRRRAPPATEGTIESDPDYLNFLAEMKGDAEREQSELAANQTAGSSVVTRHSTTDKEDSTAKGLVITPLIQDVRARRRERDERKKAKSTVRGSRGKSHGGAVPPAASIPPAAKTVESVEHVKLGAKRKKRRGGDNASKRDESAQERKGSKAGANERRNGQLRQTGANSGNTNRGSPSSPFANSNASMNGGSGSKSSSSRGGSGGRSRYSRGQKGRGRYAQNGNGTIGGKNEAASSDCVHGAVRVLKKEASVTNKT